MAREVRLTQEGYDRLKASLEHERERLEEATHILQELTGTSDDYDDSGLEDAKREKARIEQRIDELEDQLNRAVIIEDHKTTKVDLGAVVNLKEKGAKKGFDVQVVSSVEVSVLEGDVMKVSDQSPLGKALMGRKKGEVFKVAIGNKTTEYTLVSIH
jgi:transcription elongation factor GreA